MAKVEQLKKEIQREKEQSDLLDSRGQRHGRKKVERLDWMYASTAATQASGRDDIILGKRAADEVVQVEVKDDDKGKKSFALPTYSKIESTPKNQDLETKMREDPLLQMLASKKKKTKNKVAP